jgi:hypothetical protein
MSHDDSIRPGYVPAPRQGLYLFEIKAARWAVGDTIRGEQAVSVVFEVVEAERLAETGNGLPEAGEAPTPVGEPVGYRFARDPVLGWILLEEFLWAIGIDARTESLRTATFEGIRDGSFEKMRVGKRVCAHIRHPFGGPADTVRDTRWTTAYPERGGDPYRPKLERAPLIATGRMSYGGPPSNPPRPDNPIENIWDPTPEELQAFRDEIVRKIRDDPFGFSIVVTHSPQQAEVVSQVLHEFLAEIDARNDALKAKLVQPTERDLQDPRLQAIRSAIDGWGINVGGDLRAADDIHAMTILDALRRRV